MGISEKKMQIVINNYFKQECDVNTSIREAFEKGFRIGVKKTSSAQPGWISVTERLPDESGEYLVTIRYKDGGNDVTGLIKYISSWREWNDVELFGGEVIAWQPKPQPWEGGQDGED